MGMVNSQDQVIGVGTLDRFGKTILFYEAMSGPMYLVRSDEHGAHNLLKPKYYSYRSEVKDTRIVGIYPSRCKTVIFCRPDLTQVLGVNSLYLWLRVNLLIYM